MGLVWILLRKKQIGVLREACQEMEGKAVVCLLIVATVAIFSASRVEAARADLPSILSVLGVGEVPRSGADCCDVCICPLVYPPQCRCVDIKSYCPASCSGCVCTKSNPPQCWCADYNPSFCSTSCSNERKAIIVN